MYGSFSINGTELNVGQKNLYEDPCQDWLDLINKKLTSPNYPNKYPENVDCANVINYPIGVVVKVTFLEFDVHEDGFGKDAYW